jgi:hypothetical protein
MDVHFVRVMRPGLIFPSGINVSPIGDDTAGPLAPTEFPDYNPSSVRSSGRIASCRERGGAQAPHGLQKLEKLFDGEASLVNDRRERPPLQVLTVERNRDAEAWPVRMLQVVSVSFRVVNIKACSLESPKNFGGLESRQVLAHAGSGSATRIFALVKYFV